MAETPATDSARPLDSPSKSSDPEYELFPEGATLEIPSPTTVSPSKESLSRRPRIKRPDVCTFGCAPRFGRSGLVTHSPEGRTYYGRNELYGSMSCLEGKKPYGKIGKSARRTGEAPPCGTDEWTGPGSHKVDGIAQSKKGGMKSSPIDGKEFCHMTMKRGGFSTQDLKQWNPDCMYNLPSTLSTLGCGNSNDKRKLPWDGMRFVDKMYDSTNIHWGGSKEFVKSSFGVAPRSKKPDDDCRDIFYGKIELSKDERLRDMRSAAVRGRQKAPYYQNLLSRWPMCSGPGSSEISRDLNKKSHNKHFIKSKEWKESTLEPYDSFRTSLMSRSVPSLKSLRGMSSLHEGD